MSLDVWLTADNPFPQSGPRIFIRENGQNVQISREEWGRRFPGQEPVTMECDDDDRVYSGNITHNLTKMADEAGIYKPLWRPEEVGIAIAKDLIQPLTVGLALLRSDPERFKKFNPPNGWGDYDGLVRFVDDYLTACKAHPSATIGTWR